MWIELQILQLEAFHSDVFELLKNFSLIFLGELWRLELWKIGFGFLLCLCRLESLFDGGKFLFHPQPQRLMFVIFLNNACIFSHSLCSYEG